MSDEIEKIRKECKETGKVKIGTFEFEDCLVDAEVVLAQGYPFPSAGIPLQKIEAARYEVHPEKSVIWVYMIPVSEVIPINLEYWKYLVTEAYKQYSKDDLPKEPVIIRIPDRYNLAIYRHSEQPGLQLTFKPKPNEKKGLLKRLNGGDM